MYVSQNFIRTATVAVIAVFSFSILLQSANASIITFEPNVPLGGDTFDYNQEFSIDTTDTGDDTCANTAMFMLDVIRDDDTGNVNFLSINSITSDPVNDTFTLDDSGFNQWRDGPDVYGDYLYFQRFYYTTEPDTEDPDILSLACDSDYPVYEGDSNFFYLSEPPPPEPTLEGYPYTAIVGYTCTPDEEATTTTLCVPEYDTIFTQYPTYTHSDDMQYALYVIIFLLTVQLVIQLTPKNKWNI